LSRCLGGGGVVKAEVSGPQRGTVELEEPASLEDAVDDGRGEIRVVEHAAPVGEPLVGREDHGALAKVAVVHDVEEDVGGVVAVGEVADLVDHEQVGMGVGGQRLDEVSLASGAREVVDQLRGRGEVGLEAVLDGPVGEGDRQVRLASPALAGEHEAAAFGHEVGRESRAQQREPQCRLVGEVELVDGLEEGELGPAREALDARLLAVGHLLGHEHGEELAVGPLLALGARDELAVDAPGVGQVEPLEHRLEVDLGGRHSGSSRCAGVTRIAWR
jgi:hypothetical protein